MALSGTGDSQRDSRESIRAHHSQLNPYFYSASDRFARITRISDSRESPDSRESCESIRANHATKIWRIAELVSRYRTKTQSACYRGPRPQTCPSGGERLQKKGALSSWERGSQESLAPMKSCFALVPPSFAPVQSST